MENKEYKPGDIIEIVLSSGNGESKERVTLMRVKGVLCIHKSLDRKDGFNITHIPSRRKICTSFSLEQAETALEVLSSCGFDWTSLDGSSADVRVKPSPEVCKQIAPILDQLFMRGIAVTQ